MKYLSPIFVLVLLCCVVQAQIKRNQVSSGTGAPTGACVAGYLYTDNSTGNVYSCNSGTWALKAAGGTVTGTGASGRLPLWSSSSALSSDSSATYSGTGSSFKIIIPTLQLTGSTSGASTIAAPAVAGSTAFVLPGTSGTLCGTGAVCTGYQASLGFTPFNAANVDTDSTFAANSDTKVPSQKAVKARFDALPVGVTGSGTTDKIAKFTGSGAVGNSQITDDGSVMGFGSAATLSTGTGNNFIGINGAANITVSGADADNATTINKDAGVRSEYNLGTGTLIDTAATSFSVVSPLIIFSDAAYQSCTALSTNASGNLICTVSDGSQKVIHRSFNRGLSALLSIRPQFFTWRAKSRYDDGNKEHAGLIAQNVRAAIPEAVSTNGAGNLQIEQQPLNAVFITAFQELNARVTALEKENKRLRARLRRRR